MSSLVRNICEKAKNASYNLALATSDAKNNMLRAIADEILANKNEILAVNKLDMDNATQLSEAMKDRLFLTAKRIETMAEGVLQVATLGDPVGEIVENWTRPNGLVLSKVRVPLGVIAVIYEARPNVTIDVASLCIKSGNCVILRGGKEAINSNRLLYQIAKKALKNNGFDEDIIGFIDDTSRDSSLELLQQADCLDVIIPRGGEGLKKFILDNTTVPVIASAGGNCHLYIEESADLEMADKVVYNAKMSRPSVCNALEQLLIDRSIANKFLPTILQHLHENGCVIKGCDEVCSIFGLAQKAEAQDFKTEHHDYELTVKVVDNYLQAIDIINKNNTRHSDGIISKNAEKIEIFKKKVDTACLYVNASTRFTDGFEFGFGAEIAISTQKLHARGPLGLKQLTSEKYIICGNGQVRI